MLGLKVLPIDANIKDQASNQLCFRWLFLLIIMNVFVRIFLLQRSVLSLHSRCRLELERTRKCALFWTRMRSALVGNVDWRKVMANSLKVGQRTTGRVGGRGGKVEGFYLKGCGFKVRRNAI